MIGRAVRERLLADAAIAALVGTRVFPNEAEQNAPNPLIVYSQVSAVRGLTYAGADNLTTKRIQVDIYADRYADARSLANLARQSLHGWAGTSAGVVIQLSRLENEIDGYENATNEHRVSLDFLITVEE